MCVLMRVRVRVYVYMGGCVGVLLCMFMCLNDFELFTIHFLLLLLNPIPVEW